MHDEKIYAVTGKMVADGEPKNVLELGEYLTNLTEAEWNKNKANIQDELREFLTAKAIKGGDDGGAQAFVNGLNIDVIFEGKDKFIFTIPTKKFDLGSKQENLKGQHLPLQYIEDPVLHAEKNANDLREALRSAGLLTPQIEDVIDDFIADNNAQLQKWGMDTDEGKYYRQIGLYKTLQCK